MLQLTGSEISPPLVVVIWERCYRSWWWIHMTKQNLKKINSLEQFWYEGWIRQVNQANAFFWNRETDPFMSYYIQIIRSQPSIKLGRQSEGKRSCNDTRWFRRQNRRKWQRLRAGYGQTWFGGDEREWRKLCRLLRRLQPCHQRKPVPTQGSPRGNMDITWPNNRKSVDHICISPQFRRSLLHVRVKRGADAASDHHLRVARVRLTSWSLFDRSSNFNQSARDSQTVLGVHSFASVSPNELYMRLNVVVFIVFSSTFIFFRLLWISRYSRPVLRQRIS